MDLSKIIAANLKRLRQERNLSIGQLAKKSGVSKAMLSDIEKGGGNPTINTIWKIANGLQVSYTKLIDHVERETTVIRRSEAVMQSGETASYRVYCYYKTAPRRDFELFYAELDAGASNSSIGHSAASQEYIYVIRGELTLRTDGTDHVLNTGDSLVFDSSLAHTYVNGQRETLQFLVINYYPN